MILALGPSVFDRDIAALSEAAVRKPSQPTLGPDEADYFVEAG